MFNSYSSNLELPRGKSREKSQKSPKKSPKFVQIIPNEARSSRNENEKTPFLSVLRGFMGVNQNEVNRDILTHNQVVVGSNPTGPTENQRFTKKCLEEPFYLH